MESHTLTFLGPSDDEFLCFFGVSMLKTFSRLPNTDPFLTLPGVISMCALNRSSSTEAALVELLVEGL